MYRAIYNIFNMAAIRKTRFLASVSKAVRK